MVTLLGRNFLRFESWITTIGGSRFRGSIAPAGDSVPGNALVEQRLLLRTRPNEPVVIGSVITDPLGRLFLVGRDDSQVATSFAVARTYRLFAMTYQASWKKLTTVIDPVTTLAQRSGFVEAGPIWCSIEILANMDVDKGTHMGAEKRRVITGSPIQLQDKVDGNIVRRVTPVFGIYIGEIE